MHLKTQRKGPGSRETMEGRGCAWSNHPAGHLSWGHLEMCSLPCPGSCAPSLTTTYFINSVYYSYKKSCHSQTKHRDPGLKALELPWTHCSNIVGTCRVVVTGGRCTLSRVKSLFHCTAWSTSTSYTVCDSESFHIKPPDGGRHMSSMGKFA